MRPPALLPLLSAVLALTATLPARAGKPPLFHEDFSAGDAALKKFTFTDPAAWKIVKDKVGDREQTVLALTQQSKYKPAVRSPVNQAWINDLKVSHFVMDVKVRSTQK